MRCFECCSGLKRRACLYVLLAIFTAIILFAVFFSNSPGEEVFQVSDCGVLSIEGRMPIDCVERLVEEDTAYTLSEIDLHANDGYVISALFRVPKTEEQLCGAVILPGATVSKEGGQHLAGELAGIGYASIALDQRNLCVIDFEKDYQLFASGDVPAEYLMLSDALHAVDFLISQPEVDARKIIIIGESNGGRIAIIAAAMHQEIRMVIGISTSGYNTGEQIPKNAPDNMRKFYYSIDPDTYLPLLPPKKLVLIHADNDPIIPLELAERTYQKADEPKALHVVSGNMHGYGNQMQPVLKKELLSFRKAR
ncbi:MAG: alpha/beta hydrolase [Methanosarcinales archaeon]|nr:MAG: alpha/beta hydrolase [Methanosarcinales archaeon]